MIFVTVGTQFGFDRLIRWMDEWAAENMGTEIIAQIGNGDYLPKNMRWIREVDPIDFPKMVDRCGTLISHAGMGTIISARLAKKRVIIVPRQAALGEHRNDHQLATADRFEATSGIQVARSADELFCYLTASVHVEPNEMNEDLVRLLSNLAQLVEAA